MKRQRPSTSTPDLSEKQNGSTPNERLKGQRVKRNWTQVYVATRIGANEGEISRWETGRTSPGLYFREKLCALFALTPEELGFVPVGPLRQEYQQEPSQPFWNVPSRRNPFFTGREAQLASLHALLRAGESAGTSVLAVSGLGGIGKTQLALEYAYRYRSAYAAVLWMQADTPARLLSELAALASFLQLPEAQVSENEIRVQAVKQWLHAHTGWLLLLDNVSDLVTAGASLPSEAGHVLITTRAQASGSLARHIMLEKMTPEEGTRFLLRRAKLPGSDEPLEQIGPTQLEHARAIVQVLDGLPLALDQAGAYCEETGCGLPNYLARYQTRKADLLKRRGSLVLDHPASVSTTFSLAYEQIEHLNKGAAELLKFCAFLDPEALPEELLTGAASEAGPVLAPVAGDPLAFDEAIMILRIYSLLHRHPETRTLSTHRLVQEVLRESMDAQERRQWAERAVRAVHRVFPREATLQTWPRCQFYLPSLQICSSLIEQEHFHFPEAMQLLTRAGASLRDRACYDGAERALQQALYLHEHSPEADSHQDVFATLHHLGLLYFEQGRWSEAELCWQRAYRLLQPHQAADLRDQVEILQHLGTLYLEQKRIQEAEPLCQRALTLWQQQETEHPLLIHGLINLGYCYIQQRRYSEAEPPLQRALTLLAQQEPEHLYIFHCLSHLGRIHLSQGDYDQAEAFLQRGVALWEQLDFPHPCTALVLSSLGRLRLEQERYNEAEVFLRRALHFWEQVHFHFPLISESLSDLAHLCLQQGNDVEAQELLQRALSIQERWLGREHPDTRLIAERYTDLVKKV